MMAARPLGGWKLLLGLGHEVKYECGPTPLGQLCRLERNRGSTRQIISELIGVLPSPVMQQTDEGD